MILSGKRALVLGASRGVGRAIARSLAGHGAHLILPWFDWPESVAELEEDLDHELEQISIVLNAFNPTTPATISHSGRLVLAGAFALVARLVVVAAVSLGARVAFFGAEASALTGSVAMLATPPVEALVTA